MATIARTARRATPVRQTLETAAVTAERGGRLRAELDAAPEVLTDQTARWRVTILGSPDGLTWRHLISTEDAGREGRTDPTYLAYRSDQIEGWQTKVVVEPLTKAIDVGVELRAREDERVARGVR